MSDEEKKIITLTPGVAAVVVTAEAAVVAVAAVVRRSVGAGNVGLARRDCCRRM